MTARITSTPCTRRDATMAAGRRRGRKRFGLPESRSLWLPTTRAPRTERPPGTTAATAAGSAPFRHCHRGCPTRQGRQCGGYGDLAPHLSGADARGHPTQPASPGTTVGRVRGSREGLGVSHPPCKPFALLPDAVRQLRPPPPRVHGTGVLPPGPAGLGTAAAAKKPQRGDVGAPVQRAAGTRSPSYPCEGPPGGAAELCHAWAMAPFQSRRLAVQTARTWCACV